jgi:hypothetical protein
MRVLRDSARDPGPHDAGHRLHEGGSMNPADPLREALADAIARATDEDLSDGGRYFHDSCCDLTKCGHGDTGEYQHSADGKLVELLWNNRHTLLQALSATREEGDDCDLCFGIMSRACPRCNPCANEAPSDHRMSASEAGLRYRNPLGETCEIRTADEMRKAWSDITEHSGVWPHAKRFLHRIGMTDADGAPLAAALSTDPQASAPEQGVGDLREAAISSVLKYIEDSDGLWPQDAANIVDKVLALAALAQPTTMSADGDKVMREFVEDAVPILEAVLDYREDATGEEDEILRDLLDRAKTLAAATAQTEAGDA